MKKTQVIACVLAGLLFGCDQPEQPKAIELSCNDSPQGRSKAEQTAIADACFRQGRFKKSSGMEW